MIILSFSPIINRVKKSHFPLSMHAVSLRRKKFSAQCWSDQGMMMMVMMMMMMIMTIIIIKKRKYNSRVTEIEQGTFTPLVFTTTGGMAHECLRYHSRLAGAIICKKARELRHNVFMGQGESVLCNFAERAPMPKGIENPEKEELKC